MKKLPKAQKNMKNFILGEDAKIIDKTITKIALTTSFMAIGLTNNILDVNAGGHSNHSNHSNYVAMEGPSIDIGTAPLITDPNYNGDSPSSDKIPDPNWPYPEDVDGTKLYTDPNLGNDENTTYQKNYSGSGKILDIEVDPMSVKTTHANHFNHANGSGSS